MHIIYARISSKHDFLECIIYISQKTKINKCQTRRDSSIIRPTVNARFVNKNELLFRRTNKLAFCRRIQFFAKFLTRTNMTNKINVSSFPLRSQKRIKSTLYEMRISVKPKTRHNSKLLTRLPV